MNRESGGAVKNMRRFYRLPLRKRAAIYAIKSAGRIVSGVTVEPLPRHPFHEVRRQSSRATYQIEISWLMLIFEACQKAQKVLITNGFIGFTPSSDPLIGPPPHPFRFRWHVIVDRDVILAPELAANSLCHRERPVRRRFKLRAIGDLPPPCLATGEGSRAGKFPKH
jgi:hypothetical protein